MNNDNFSSPKKKKKKRLISGTDSHWNNNVLLRGKKKGIMGLSENGIPMLLFSSALFPIITISIAVDTINTTQSISHGDAMVSAAGSFKDFPAQAARKTVAWTYGTTTYPVMTESPSSIHQVCKDYWWGNSSPSQSQRNHHSSISGVYHLSIETKDSCKVFLINNKTKRTQGFPIACKENYYEFKQCNDDFSLYYS